MEATTTTTTPPDKNLFNYHPVDLIHGIYTTERKGLFLQSSPQGICQWTTNVIRRSDRTRLAFTIVQGGSSSAYEKVTTSPFDGFVNLTTPADTKHLEGHVAFSVLSTAFHEALSSDDIKKWRATTAITSELDRAMLRGARGGRGGGENPLILGPIRTLQCILDLAFRSKTNHVHLLVVCKVGRERSLLFTQALILTLDALVSLPTVPLSYDELIALQHTWLQTSPVAPELEQRATPIYVQNLDRYPYYYMHLGRIAQGNKRILEVLQLEIAAWPVDQLWCHGCGDLIEEMGGVFCPKSVALYCNRTCRRNTIATVCRQT